MIYIIGGDIGSGKTLYALFLMERAAAAGRPIYTNIQLTRACPYFDSTYLIDTPEFPVARDPDGDALPCWNCGAPHRKPRNAKAGSWQGDPPKDGERPYEYFWEYIEPGAMVVVDEADLYFDCSDHGSMPREVRRFHKLSRKVECDLVYIVQNFENMYVRIRRLATRHIVCEYTWRSMRVFRYLEMFLGMEGARRLARFIRSEFQDQQCRQHKGDGYFTYQESSRYFSWYDTKQLMGDNSFMRTIEQKPTATLSDAERLERLASYVKETEQQPLTLQEVAMSVPPQALEEAWSALEQKPLHLAKI